jgi:DNA-binding response OmpR family regulator
MDEFRIMVIEDDPALKAHVAGGLAQWGLVSLTPDPASDLLAAFIREKPQLVILDVGLPRFDGFEWCSRIREISRVPILFLSARSHPADMVRALATGGDDWLAKPFDTDLLVAKVKALLRRCYSWAPSEVPLLERSGLVLDRERGCASSGGRRVELTRNETALLRRLMERDGRIVSRDELMDALWSEDAFVDDNTLTVNITRLKKTLSEIGADSLIETVRGSGYRIL